jgi:hypothetical protein
MTMLRKGTGVAKPKGNYETGYCKPPRGHQFKPGQSGNPTGRPKTRKSLDELIDKELGARIMVNEGGERRSITKEQAMAKQLVNKAASGDHRAIRHVSEVRSRVAERRQQEAEKAAEKSDTSIDYSLVTDEDMLLIMQYGTLMGRYHEAKVLFDQGLFDPRDPPIPWVDGRPPPPMPPSGPRMRPWDMEGYNEARAKAGIPEVQPSYLMDLPESVPRMDSRPIVVDVRADQRARSEAQEKPIWEEEGYDVDEDGNEIPSSSGPGKSSP